MKIGMVGLGRMGGNMSNRLLRAGHKVVAHDLNEAAVGAVIAEGGVGASSLEALVAGLGAGPRAVWVMLPAGGITQGAIDALAGVLEPGDVIVDGGNANYRDSQARAAAVAAKGIHFVDAGVSGGVWGLENGYGLMVGGDPAAIAVLQPVFDALAPPGGFVHCGPVGAGHFTKMVHNGIEYGLMQAYGEGFALLASAPELGMDHAKVAAIAEAWRHGTVVRSWLLDLAALALADEPGFAAVKGYVDDSGEGRWTVKEGVDRGVPLPVISASLFERFSSRDPDLYSNRVLAALRNQFGGHAIKVDPS